MKLVRNYMKNIMKSVAYASSDVAKEDLMPNMGEFLDSNKAFVASTYAAIRHPKAAVRKKVDSFKESKYFTALDYTSKNLMEDLRTGKFYNRQREAEGQSQFGGSMFNVSDWNDLSDWDVDMSDLDNLDSDSGFDDTFTNGDVQIVKSVEATSRASTNATTNAIMAASEYNVKNSRANIGILYNQNEKLFSGLHSDISMVNSTIDSIYKIMGNVLPNIDKNLSDFFTETSKTNKRILAMMEESLEMQRNMYKDANTKQKEELNKRNKVKKLRYSDVVIGNGLPDIEQYIAMVKQNIKDNSQTGGMMSMFNSLGEDSNMLAMMGASPLKGLVTGAVKAVIPATIKAATKELDNTVSGVFSTALAALANKRDDYTGGVVSKLAKYLAPNLSVNKSLDASRYTKGAIPFDGITRKAIIDVIPTYLRRIEAVLSGRSEIMYDYDSGRWVNSRDVKKGFERIRKSSIDNATSDLMKNMKPGLKMIKGGIKSKREEREFEDAIEEFKQYLYDHNGVFNPKRSASYNEITPYQYKNLSKYYKEIQTAFLNFDVDADSGRHTKLSSRLVSNRVMEAKDRENRQYRDLEEKGYSVYGQYYSSGLKFDSHGKWDKDRDRRDRETFTVSNPILDTKDKLGNSVFNYLQKISAELRWQRESGFENINNLITYYGGIGGGNGPFNPVSAVGPLPLTRRRNRRPNLRSSALSENDIRSLVISNSTLREERDKSTRSINIDDEVKRNALSKIAKNEAIDHDMFDDNELEYITRLSNLIATKATDEYRKEISGLANESEVSAWLNRNIYGLRKNKVQSSSDIKKELEDKAKENDKKEEEGSDKEATGLKALINEFKLGQTKLNKIMSAPAEIFTNLLYSADRAIYDMMFKAKIKNDDDDEEDENGKVKKEYNGFIDMLAGKTLNTFKRIKETITTDVIDPLKKRFGIDEDFSDRYKETFKNLGGTALKWFANSTKEVYSPVIKEIQKSMGITPGENLAEKARRTARLDTSKDIEYVNNNQDIIDDKFLQIARQYGIKVEDYDGDINAIKQAINNEANKRLYEKSNNLKEFANMEEFDRMLSAIKNMDNPTQEFAKIRDKNDLYGSLTGSNVEELSENIRKLAENINKMQINNTELNENTITSDQIQRNDINAQRRWLYQNKMVSNRDITSQSDASISRIFKQQEQNQILKNLYSTDNNGNHNKLGDKINGSNHITDPEQQLLLLVNNGVLDPTSPEYEYISKSPKAINKKYLRWLLSNTAYGTPNGIPFMGNTMLSKGEMLFNDDGISMVNKTDAYRINKPTQILNSYDSNPILRSMGINPGPRRTPDQDLREENRIKDNLFNNANGTISRILNNAEGTTKQKKYDGSSTASYETDNDDANKEMSNSISREFGKTIDGVRIRFNNSGIDFDEMKQNAKKFAPEAVASGTIGAIASTLLGIAGGPILGALIGSAAGVVGNSEDLKDKFFGKKDKDGKRNGGKLVNSTIMNAVNRYVPDIAKYGAAGIIPGLITPLGPIGGILAGGAIGFLKNNDSFMNKYFGDVDENGNRTGGKITLNSKSRRRLKQLLPGFGMGAGAGAVASLFVPNFGILGGAAIGSAIGMMASTDEFKDSILGKSINGVRSGGLMGAITDAFEPLKQTFKDVGSKLVQIIDKNVADPLANFIVPFVNRLPRIMGYVPKMLNRFLEKHIAGPAGNFLKRVLFNPASKLLGGAVKLGSKAFNVVTTPFRALGGIGNHMRKKDIQNGYADYMTAQERINFMEDKGNVIRDDDGNEIAYTGENGNGSLRFDQALADIGKQGSQFENINDARDLLNRMSSITDTVSGIDSAKKKLGKNVLSRLAGWKGEDGASISPKAISAMRSALKNNNIDKAKKILTTFKLSNGRMMTPQEYQALMNSVEDEKGLSLDNQFRRFSDFYKRKEIAGRMTKDQKDSIMNRVSQEFQDKFGIKINGSNDLKRYASMLDTEIVNANANPERREEKAIYNDNTDALNSLSRTISTANDLLKQLLTGSHKDLNSATVEYANRVNDAANENVEDRFNWRRQDAAEYSGSEDESVIDKLTESATVGANVSRNPVTNTIQKGISVLKGDKYRFYWETGILNDKTVKGINYRDNNLKQQQRIVDAGYNFDDNATIEFNKLTKPKAKSIRKKLRNISVLKFFKGAKLTKEDIKAIDRISEDDLANIAESLHMAGYTINGKKVKDIIALGRQKAKEINRYRDLDDQLPQYDDEEDADDISPANHAIGTFLLSAIGKGAKKLGSAALKKGKNLAKRGINGIRSKASDTISNITNRFKKTPQDAIQDALPRTTLQAGNLDEVDKPNDGKDIVINPETGEGIQVKRDSDGSVVPDTSDNKTKEILNRVAKEREERKKMQENIAKSTKVTEEGLEGEQKGGKKLKWWQLLLGAIVAAPFLKKIFDGVVKPLWDDKLKPWIKDTAIPWITNTALPALGSLIADGVKIVADMLITSLPGIIKGALNLGGSVLDTLTGNNTNVGKSTAVETANHDDNEETTITDDTGKKLTYGDLKNHNYEGNLYNEQGAVATSVDDNGNVNFNDESKPGQGFLAAEGKTMLNAVAYGRSGKLNKLAGKAGSKLLNRKGKLLNKTGKIIGGALKTITKPIEIAGNIGQSIKNGTFKATVNSTVDNIANSKIVKTATETLSKLKSAERGTITSRLTEAAESGGVKGTVARVVKSVSGAVEKLFSNNKVIKKVAEMAEKIGIKNAGQWIIKFKDSIKSIFSKAMETNAAKYTASAAKTAVNTIGKFITPIMLAVDFLTGCDKAEKILGVSETSIVEEVVAGIINALCNFLILPSIIPGTDAIARMIFKLIPNSNIEERQKEADAEVEKYNKDNGTTYTKEEYLNRKKSITGKIGGWFSDRWKDVKSFFGKGTSANKTIESIVNQNQTIANTNNSSVYNQSNNTSQYGKGYDKQIDPRIANLPFNVSGDTDKQTIGDSACGPVAAVNAIKSMNYGRGTNDVLNASAYALNNGYKEKNGGTTPAFFDSYFNKQGLNSTTTSNKNDLSAMIKSGQPTVLMGSDSNGISRNTPYGTNPHYVTVTGTDGRGNAIVQDPESKYDNQLYNINKLMSKSSFGVSVTGKGSNYLFKSRYGRSKYGRGLRGNSLEEQAFNFFIDNGFAKGAAAGAVGNLMAESGFDHIDPSAVESNGEGVGIVQWSFSRKTAFLNYCQSQGNPFPNNDIGLQLGFIIKELKGDGVEQQWAFDSRSGWASEYNMGLDQFLSCNDPNLAAGAFCACFERPNKAKSHIDQRITNAVNVYNQYSGNSAVSGNTMSNNSASSTDVASGLIGALSESKAGKALSAITSLFTGSSNDSSTDTSSSTSTSSSTGSASGPVEAATKQMETWADDPNVGYDQTYRWGERNDYDCSSSVISAWTKAGVDLKGQGASYTGNMYDVCIKMGFKDVTSSVNLSDGTGLQRGDILLNKSHHVAMWTGSEIVNASQNENGHATGGQPGETKTVKSQRIA